MRFLAIQASNTHLTTQGIAGIGTKNWLSFGDNQDEHL
jgi:hypothetical protein